MAGLSIPDKRYYTRKPIDQLVVEQSLSEVDRAKSEIAALGGTKSGSGTIRPLKSDSTYTFQL
jgi:hypothetical protein